MNPSSSSSFTLRDALTINSLALLNLHWDLNLFVFSVAVDPFTKTKIADFSVSVYKFLHFLIQNQFSSDFLEDESLSPTGMAPAGTGVLRNISPGKLHTLRCRTNSVKGVPRAEKIKAQQLDFRAAGRMMNERCANLLSLPPSMFTYILFICPCVHPEILLSSELKTI